METGYDGRSRYFRFEIKLDLAGPGEIVIDDALWELDETRSAA